MSNARRPELDEYLPDCQVRAMKGFCDGSCEEHRGVIMAVRVLGDGVDWGWFSYCEEAMAEDHRRGMTLEFNS